MTEPPTGSPWNRDTHTPHTAHTPPRPHPSHDAHSPHEPEPPFEGPVHALSRATWQFVLLTGVASVILGIVVLVWPGPSLLAAGVLFGLYLLVSGVFQLMTAFGTHRTTSLRVLAFISGALSLLLGLVCFRAPLRSILLLALWIGIGWLIRGITQTLAAASDPTMPARGWQALLGVVTFLGGVVLIDSPFESVTVLTVVGGVWLVAVGAVEIVTALRIRGRAQQVPHTV